MKKSDQLQGYLTFFGCKRISRLLAFFFCVIPYEAAAVMAVEIKPQDVYQAGYCSAFLEGAVSAGTENIPPEAANTIRLHALDLIEGGDNLNFAPFGEEAARVDLIEIFGVKGGTGMEATKDGALAAKVKDCAALLTDIVELYSLRSCGYGRNRNFSEVYSWPEEVEELSLFDRLKDMLR